MKYICLFIAVLVFGCSSVDTINMNKHPLNHKNFKVIDYPISNWSDGCCYHTEVMEYVFKSKDEQKLAIARLLEAGYGEGKENFIYVNKNKISINGKIFSSLAEAKEYIKKNQEDFIYRNNYFS